MTVAVDEPMKIRVLEHQAHLAEQGLRVPESECLRLILRKGLEVVEAERKKKKGTA